MNRLDELNEKLARLLNQRDELLNNHKEQIRAINDEISNVEEVVSMLASFLSSINESFQTLCVSHQTGGASTAEFITFACEVGLETPPDFEAAEEVKQEDNGEEEAVP